MLPERLVERLVFVATMTEVLECGSGTETPFIGHRTQHLMASLLFC